MQRPLTAMGRRARSCPPGLWPPVQSGRLRSLARSLWQKRWPRSGAEAMCSVGPTMFAGCLQRPLRAEHFPQRAPAGRLLLGRNGGSLLPRLRKREGLPPREGVSCGGARPPPPLPGEKGPFCRQMAHGRSGGPAGGERAAAAPLFACSQRPSQDVRRWPLRLPAVLRLPPLPGGEKGGPFGRGLLAGACVGEARPLPPGGSASKGGTVALALGVKNWYPEGRYRARCWRAGTEKGGEGQWSGSTFTWKICGSIT